MRQQFRIHSPIGYKLLMKKVLRSLSVTAGVFLSLIGALRAENIPDLFLHEGEPLNGAWQVIVDPYETGFYDYRWKQRDASPDPSRAETFYLDVKPADPG